MKLKYDDFELEPCDVAELPPFGIRLGAGMIIRVPSEEPGPCNIFTDHDIAWAHVEYLSHKQAFRVLTLDGAPYTDMDEQSANRRADAIATGFAAHVDNHGGEAPTF